MRAGLFFCALWALAATEAFADDGAEVPAAPEISRTALSERWTQSHKNLTLVDVRTAEEFAAGHVPGAINIPLDQLPTRWQELASENEIVVYCLSGVRAAQAIDLLRGRAFKRIEHLTGDFAEWQSNGGAVETSAP
jgi:rhodanese-related sulfurtransferase